MRLFCELFLVAVLIWLGWSQSFHDRIDHIRGIEPAPALQQRAREITAAATTAGQTTTPPPTALRRGSHFFLRVRVRPPRPAATGCGTRRIVIPSISPPTRPGVLNKHLVKAIGSTAAACATMATARRPRARRKDEQARRLIVISCRCQESRSHRTRSKDRDRSSEKEPFRSNDLTIYA